MSDKRVYEGKLVYASDGTLALRETLDPVSYVPLGLLTARFRGKYVRVTVEVVKGEAED